MRSARKGGSCGQYQAEVGALKPVRSLAKKESNILRKERDMSEAVARHLHLSRSTCELKVKDCAFDVVAYDERNRLFKIVECKMGTSPRSIGRTFGQVAAYCAVLSDSGREFINEFSKRIQLPFERLMEATENNKHIRVEFYVALRQDACKRVEFIQAIKGLLPRVGIIRVKPDGKCRNYLRINGKKVEGLAKATPTRVKMLSHNSSK